MQIIQDFIPQGRKNRPGNQMSPNYITIHNTANADKGANAEMHARYVKNSATAVSWHYTVDDGDTIYQHLPTNESGFHAGDGTGMGNRQSIGIEICENAGINQDTANANAMWLIRKLMNEHNISITNVVPHQKWSGKNCPHKLLPVWDSFIAKIKNGEAQVPPPSVSDVLSNGSKGDAVKQLQNGLNKLGYNLSVDGIFGKATDAAVKAFQGAQGLVVDGYFGPLSQSALTKATVPKSTSSKVLKYGDSGTEVKAMQQALASVYFYPDYGAKNNGVDGYFGVKTLDALKRFQSIQTPKEVDGIYGPKTKAALDKLKK